jgi:hypothetical protein
MADKTRRSVAKIAEHKLVAVVTLLLIVPATMSLLFFNFYTMLDVPNPSSKMALPIVILPIAAILFFLIIVITNLLKKFRYKKAALVVFSALIIISQFVLMFSANPMPSFDAASLVATPFNNETVDYAFYANSNNSLLGAFFIIVHNIVSIFSGGSDILAPFMYTVISLSIICVDFSIACLLYLAKRLLKSRGLIIAYILAAYTALTFPSILIPYSDTYAMPFVMLILLFGVKIFDEFKKPTPSKNLVSLYVVLICILNVVGYLIKPTVVFATFSLLLVLLFVCLRNKKQIKKAFPIGKVRWSLIGILAVVSILSVSQLKLAATKYIYASKDTPMSGQYINDRSATFLHFLSTGSNPGFGYFDSVSANNLYSSENQNEINDGAIQILRDRLNENGALWYVGLLAEKNLMNLSDGVFFYGEFGGNKDASSPFATTDQTTFLYEYVWPSGTVWSVYKYFANAIWLIILIGVTISALYNVRKKEFVISVCHISLICLLIFLMIFEARSRYLILYLPVLILLATNGLVHFEDLRLRFMKK